jgi:3',5'-cyclic AMP phosphodiesterase CpdA
MRLCHISDLHFGPFYSPELGESLLERLATIKPDTLVVSGDLTQRARRREFLDAAAFLERAATFIPNVVVCPGNHDIALYRFWERLFFPFSLYRAHIHPELDRVWNLQDATIVALNSVRPFSRLVQGKISRKQHALCHRAFAASGTDSLRILVVHHPVGMSEREFHHPVIPSAWSDLCGRERMDLVLTGHLHEAAVLSLQPKACPSRVLLISSGTTTSHRVRDIEELHNSFQFLEGTRHDLKIQTYAYAKGQGFIPKREFRFGKDLEPLNVTEEELRGPET